MGTGAAYRDAVGRAISSLRSGRGWSLRTLSERSGISTPYLSEIERGRKEASGATLEQIGQAFDLTLPDLLRSVADVIEEQERSGAPVPPLLRTAITGMNEREIEEMARFAAYVRWRRSPREPADT